MFLHRKLTELKSKAGVLRTERAELHDAVAIFQNEIAGLKSEKAKLKDANLKQKFEIELTGQMINKVSESISLNEREIRNYFINSAKGRHFQYPAFIFVKTFPDFCMTQTVKCASTFVFLYTLLTIFLVSI